MFLFQSSHLQSMSCGLEIVLQIFLLLLTSEESNLGIDELKGQVSQIWDSCILNRVGDNPEEKHLLHLSIHVTHPPFLPSVLPSFLLSLLPIPQNA